MKDIYRMLPMNGTPVTTGYIDTYLHTYLNGSFLELLDSGVGDIIKTAIIPYTSDVSISTMTAKVFLLSCAEVGVTVSGALSEGAVLDFFDGAATSDYIAYLDGGALPWWLRTSLSTSDTQYCVISNSGSVSTYTVTVNAGVRPAIILPSDTLVDSNGGIIYG